MPEKSIYVLAKFFFSNRVYSKEEGKTWFKLLNKNVQFKVTDGNPFFVKVEDGNLTFGSGDIPSADLTMETDINTYTSLFNGWTTPTSAWFEGKLKLRDIPSRQADYCWLIGLFRIGQGKYYWDI